MNCDILARMLLTKIKEILIQLSSIIVIPISNSNPIIHGAKALENTLNARVNDLIPPRLIVPYSSGQIDSVTVKVAPRLTPKRIRYMNPIYSSLDMFKKRRARISGNSMNGNKFIAFQRSTTGPSNKEVRNEAIAKPKKPLEKKIIDQPLISTILA
tara:strand:- start:10 stop:477 length:468 start_codon:yes stop_codon:yes gene_type:complete